MAEQIDDDDAPVEAPVEANLSDDLSSLLEQLDTGVVLMDSTLHAVAGNRAAAQLLHVEPEKLAGRSVMEMFLDHRVEEIARSATTQGSAVTEFTQVGDEERRIQVRFREGPDDGLWLFLDDVTELRRLQRIRSEFIDNLSHELRTPLTNIRLLTETLALDLDRPDVDLPPRIRERIVKIDVETGHLVQMVNELLDLSRIEAGAAELHFDTVRIPELINGAVDRLRTFADRQDVRLATDLPEGPIRLAWGDEERLGQVLVNLIHNAVKFSPSGSVVTVRARAGAGEIAVSVSDQGPGIPKQELDRIFERFYKVDKARERGKGGTGLGLSIARNIVQGHGGRIWAESDDGHGANFTFTVPIATPAGEGPR